MFESKYSNFLTALLVIIIIGIVALLGYLGYTYYQKQNINKETSEFVDSYIEEVAEENNNTTDENMDTLNEIAETPIATTGGKQKTYKGFNVVGTIEIPATDCKYPILEKVTKASIEASVAVAWGPGLNQVGNNVITGHNYRNGLFFSNNKKLVIGDKIYITDNSGTKVTYTIYDKFEAEENDTSFYARNTDGAREITLSSCTDDAKARIIILAKADDDA